MKTLLVSTIMLTVAFTASALAGSAQLSPANPFFGLSRMSGKQATSPSYTNAHTTTRRAIDID